MFNHVEQVNVFMNFPLNNCSDGVGNNSLNGLERYSALEPTRDDPDREPVGVNSMI